MSEDPLGSHDWKMLPALVREARGAAKHPAISRMGPLTKKFPSPNVSDAQVGESSMLYPWLMAPLLKPTFPSFLCGGYGHVTTF